MGMHMSALRNIVGRATDHLAVFPNQATLRDIVQSQFVIQIDVIQTCQLGNHSTLLCGNGNVFTSSNPINHRCHVIPGRHEQCSLRHDPLFPSIKSRTQGCGIRQSGITAQQVSVVRMVNDLQRFPALLQLLLADVQLN